MVLSSEQLCKRVSRSRDSRHVFLRVAASHFHLLSYALDSICGCCHCSLWKWIYEGVGAKRYLGSGVI